MNSIYIALPSGFQRSMSHYVHYAKDLGVCIFFLATNLFLMAFFAVQIGPTSEAPIAKSP